MISSGLGWSNLKRRTFICYSFHSFESQNAVISKEKCVSPYLSIYPFLQFLKKKPSEIRSQIIMESHEIVEMFGDKWRGHDDV